MDCKKTLHPFQLPPYLCLIFCFNLFCLTLFWCYIYFATNFLFYLPSTFLATILLGTTLHVAFIFRPFSSCCLSWYSTSFLSTSFFTSCSLTTVYTICLLSILSLVMKTCLKYRIVGKPFAASLFLSLSLSVLYVYIPLSHR